jgi:hypothetical protein
MSLLSLFIVTSLLEFPLALHKRVFLHLVLVLLLARERERRDDVLLERSVALHNPALNGLSLSVLSLSSRMAFSSPLVSSFFFPTSSLYQKAGNLFTARAYALHSRSIETNIPCLSRVFRVFAVKLGFGYCSRPSPCKYFTCTLNRSRKSTRSENEVCVDLLRRRKILIDVGMFLALIPHSCRSSGIP